MLLDLRYPLLLPLCRAWGSSVTLLSLPRFLRDGGHLLVRLQHHPGIFRPRVCRDQVSVGAPPWGAVGGTRPAELALPRPVPVPRYELGPALYLGWSASLLAILGGFCLGSSCCRSPDAAPAPR